MTIQLPHPPQSIRTQSGPIEIVAALAEALHVDARYARAAKLWRRLAEQGYQPKESFLKAGISMLSNGEHQLGLAWLARAQAMGTARSEVLYVQGHLFWSSDQQAAAGQIFLEGHGCSEDTLCINALGVLQWQAGAKDRALESYQQALERDPQCPMAQLNRISAAMDGKPAEQSQLEGWLSQLGSLAGQVPHRMEPWVLAGRAYRQLGEELSATQCLGRARLRKLPGRPPEVLACESDMGRAQACRMRVRGQVSSAGLDLEIELSAPVQEYEEPPRLYLNSGYAGGVRCAGSVPVLSPAPRDPSAGLTAEVGVLRVDTQSWSQDSGRWRLTLQVGGQPSGKCVHLSQDRLELTGPAAWLPIFEGRPEVEFDCELEGPEEMDLQVSTLGIAPDLDALGVEGSLRFRGGPVEISGAASLPIARLMRRHVLDAIGLWKAILPSTFDEPVRVTMVEQANSTFCYARPNYLRVPTGVCVGKDSSALVFHETGHLLWGARAQFAQSDLWLAEALAEYTLHLAEDQGLVKDYRQQSLDALDRQQGGLPEAGLKALDQNDPEAARIKGGFMIGALARMLGAETFAELLGLLLQQAEVAPLDAYTFFALAGRLHGSSLNAFAQAWAYAPCAHGATLIEVSVELDEGDKASQVSATLATNGPGLPSSPVALLICGTEGERLHLQAHIGTGLARIQARIPFALQSILVDPERREYAPASVVNLEPVL